VGGDCPFAAGEDGGDQLALVAQVGVADRVGAAVEAMEPAGLDTARYLPRRESCQLELVEADNALLVSGDSGDEPVGIGA
jgi:hypothetical protein